MRHVFIFVIIFTFSDAQTSESNISYIDETHSTISQKIKQWSKTVDDSIYYMLGVKDTNITTDKIQNNHIQKSLTVDRFFQNQRYFDTTDNTFLRLRTESVFQTKNANDHNFNISGQIPLSRSKEHLKLFVNDLNIENAKNIADENIKDNNLLPDIGILYIAPENYNILSRYSFGLSGLAPFISMRYNMPVQTNKWLIDPVQNFKYSTNEKFEEETNIYFDRPFDNLSLFRIQLHRKTQTEVDGMDYALSLQYYWSLKEKTGMRLAQSFLGNTKYRYDANTNNPKTYGGIYNYITSVSWRQNIGRDWFYYEVRPSVNFHKAYVYKANYAIYLFFDFYFGEYD